MIPEVLAADEAFRALNNRFAAETSWLEADEWQSLVTRARFAYAISPVAGFLLAFDSKPAEVSVNFDWFAERYDGLVYIDRIVVAAEAHGQGLGKTLYVQLFAEARAAGFERIGAEVNIDPPNPGSLAFHARMGFEPVNDRLLPNGKTVRYFVKTLIT